MDNKVGSTQGEVKRGKIKTYLYSAIRFYGAESFDIVKIDETFSNEAANELEKYYIKTFDSYNPEKGYNMTPGGDGTTPTPEFRKKMSALWMGNTLGKGRIPSAETRAKMSKAHMGRTPTNKGQHHSPETRAKISAANKGKVRSPESRAKISAGQVGRKHPPEIRKKMSEAQKLRRLRENPA